MNGKGQLHSPGRTTHDLDPSGMKVWVIKLFVKTKRIQDELGKVVINPTYCHVANYRTKDCN